MIASLSSSFVHSPPPSPSPKPSRRRPPIILSSFHTLPQSLPFSSSHTPISSETPPRRLQKLLLQSVAAALSFSVLAFPPPFLASEPPGSSSPPVAAADICREEEEAVEAPPQSVTNEGLVDEAWEVVDQGFFAGAASRPWSPEIWQEKKEYLHNSNIQTRSKAHEIIQKMLASLGDPYTRFLSPSEVHPSSAKEIYGPVISYTVIQQNEIWPPEHQLEYAFLVGSSSGAVITRDRLRRIFPGLSSVCCLCEVLEENPMHLFLQCNFSKNIWDSCMKGFGQQVRVDTIQTWIKRWESKIRATKHANSVWRKLPHAILWKIWEE